MKVIQGVRREFIAEYLVQRIKYLRFSILEIHFFILQKIKNQQKKEKMLKGMHHTSPVTRNNLQLILYIIYQPPPPPPPP